MADIPDEWVRLKRLSIHVKQQIMPIKAYQVDQIAQKIATFDLSSLAYRELFIKLPVSEMGMFQFQLLILSFFIKRSFKYPAATSINIVTM